MQEIKFKQMISSYLFEQIRLLEDKFGKESNEARSLKLQYEISENETKILNEEKRRHYEADVYLDFGGYKLVGLERLYRRALVIEITTICASHCRWCLRANYNPIKMNETDLRMIAKYCGSEENKNDLKEVLITGGDPFMVPDKLKMLIGFICEYAPNIKIVRIGTRVPVQDPRRINANLLNILVNYKNLNIEVGTHINSFYEITEITKQAIKELINNRIKIYCQVVLLKNVNDNVEALCKLYDELRYLGIESHYLFHCVPIKGMQHHRTTVMKGLELTKKITSSGLFSGRAKPMYSLMTDIGKITLYEETIIDKKDNYILLQSEYLYTDRIKWNKNWKLPDSAIIDKDGKMQVWYLDGPKD